MLALRILLPTHLFAQRIHRPEGLRWPLPLRWTFVQRPPDGRSDVLVTALPGYNAEGYAGSNGYSGGGATDPAQIPNIYAGDGGSDGGNGGDNGIYGGGAGSEWP